MVAPHAPDPGVVEDWKYVQFSEILLPQPRVTRNVIKWDTFVQVDNQ